MIKRIWCWLVGWPCRWNTINTWMTTREACGIWIGCYPPRVAVEHSTQECKICGKRKCISKVIGSNDG
jgi:hypothetical protein